MNKQHMLLAGLLAIFAATPWDEGGAADAQPADKPIAVKAERAFPNLRVLRPVIIANAGDGSDRLFLVTQQGIVHWIPNDQRVKKTHTFLDIQDRVVYKDKQNEEGLLGLAFHPKYKTNGEVFLYYTTADAPHTSVISQFRVSKDDPNRADPDSEQEIMRIKQPFWNHNGGTIQFGPDGYLYVGLGDGGSANDPHGNGQNLETLLGSILRIDVDHKDAGKEYAIPKDNPFAGNRDARGEIWAYGLRNVWRLCFDRKTGTLWAGDVGQDLWEEIDIIRRGGNYGWNLREAKHPFGKNGSGPRKDLIDPIWEYHHSIGKSITGGCVYRGRRVPELVGKYVYADYVTGRLWALDYDLQKNKVVANYTIAQDDSCPVEKIPVMTFGEDEQGEIYFGDSFGFLYRYRSAR